MVSAKNVKFRDEKSPSPKRFEEPEGMTDIDLRRLSELSGFSDSSVKKFTQKSLKSGACKALLVASCLTCALIMILLITSNRGMPLRKLLHMERRQDDVDELVSYYIDKLGRCKSDKTLEACCTYFSAAAADDSDSSEFPLQDCTVDRIIEAIERHELKSLESDVSADLIRHPKTKTTTTYYPSSTKEDDFDQRKTLYVHDYIDPDFLDAILRRNLETFNKHYHSFRDNSGLSKDIQDIINTIMEQDSNGEETMKIKAPIAKRQIQNIGLQRRQQPNWGNKFEKFFAQPSNEGQHAGQDFNLANAQSLTQNPEQKFDPNEPPSHFLPNEEFFDEHLRRNEHFSKTNPRHQEIDEQENGAPFSQALPLPELHQNQEDTENIHIMRNAEDSQNENQQHMERLQIPHSVHDFMQRKQHQEHQERIENPTENVDTRFFEEMFAHREQNPERFVENHQNNQFPLPEHANPNFVQETVHRGSNQQNQMENIDNQHPNQDLSHVEVPNLVQKPQNPHQQQILSENVERPRITGDSFMNNQQRPTKSHQNNQPLNPSLTEHENRLIGGEIQPSIGNNPSTIEQQNHQEQNHQEQQNHQELPNIENIPNNQLNGVKNDEIVGEPAPFGNNGNNFHNNLQPNVNHLSFQPQINLDEMHGATKISKVMNLNPIFQDHFLGEPNENEDPMISIENTEEEVDENKQQRNTESQQPRNNENQNLGNFATVINSENSQNGFKTENQCISTYTPPVGSPLSIIQQQVPFTYVDSSPKFAQIVPISIAKSPPMNSYVINPQYMYMPQQNAAFQTAGQPGGLISNVNMPGTGNAGQYFICNPVATSSSANNIAGMPGVEVRRQSEGHLLAATLHASDRKALTRKSDVCPANEELCANESKCINSARVCDDVVNCNDGSDEAFCSCKYRVGNKRLCDAYLDCPNGEDEISCFGCQPGFFNCDDWSYGRDATCIPMSLRCDGIRQCPTGKDEQDCSVLLDTIESNTDEVKISHNKGFLHRNYQGQWYPACANPEVWAMDACKSQIGNSRLPPLTHMIATDFPYKGPYLSAGPENSANVVEGCLANRAVHVECPQPTCGTRKITLNPYRPEEVDTSAEEIAARFRPVRNVPSFINDTLLGNERVVGGKACQPAAWPWIVSIYKNGIFHCGGVLISDIWIITAAHCVDKYWNYYYEVELGMLRRFSYSPMQQTRYVVDIIPHGGYDRGNLKNDLALMRMNAPVKYNRYVRPICLPTEVTAGKDHRRAPMPGTVCTAVGWGATIEHGADPDQLREVEVPVLSNCKHKEDAEGNEICAGLFQGGKDACQGDSGGPFLCRNPNMPDQWYLAGIVSHGEGCARPNEPGVYTRVSLYMDWIYDHAKDEMVPPRKPLDHCPGYMCKNIRKCIPKKRRCDKIVDCLYGDDEIECERRNSFSSLFKHAMEHMIITPEELSARLAAEAASSKSADDDTIANGTFEMVNGTIRDPLNGTANHDTSFASPQVPISDRDEFITNATTTEDNDNMNRNSNSSGFLHTEMDGMLDNASSTTTLKSLENVTQAMKSLKKDEHFLCTKMLQVIPLSKKCDKIIDCQDGTDETSCSCADYLKNSHPEAICDGTTDCKDLSDENGCSTCTSERSFYYCKLSKTCIPIENRCDSKPDCLHKEDEWDCFTLTTDHRVLLDADRRPVVNTKGILSFYRNGIWRAMCGNFTGVEGKISADICISLGFNDYDRYSRVRVTNTSLQTGNADDPKGITKDNALRADNDDFACTALYVKCSKKSVSGGNHELGTEDELNAPSEIFMTPWNAALYSDGELKCTGTILNLNWVLTSVACYEGILNSGDNYLAARMGYGKHFPDILGPHEQVVSVERRIRVAETEAVLLRLAKAIKFTRYVRPLHKQGDIVRHRETCLATGPGPNGTIVSVGLEAQTNCTESFSRCFQRVTTQTDCDKVVRPRAWSGVIVCDSGNGFYPAAVYQDERSADCGFNSSTKPYKSVFYMKRDIFNITSNLTDMDTSNGRTCDGHRCSLGNCLPKNKICDGIVDCMDGSDENSKFCLSSEDKCHSMGTCVCPADHLRCNNAKCVPKMKFCDSVDDCGDNSDEPKVCNCRSYLNLVNPKKICDGVRNCYDRSDEDPKLCRCNSTQFKCSSSQNCISNDMVCDGYSDCEDNSDEKQCFLLKSRVENARFGEVLTRTAGIWHSGCFPLRLSTSELEKVCENLGFSGNGASYWKPSVNETAPQPVLEKFDNFWVHNSPDFGRLLMGYRNGENRFVTFGKNSTTCHKLFISCL